MNIGYDFINNEVIKNNKAINLEEEKILDLFLNELSNTYNKNDFKIIANSDDYLTLQYKEIDIARVKYTERAKWVSILMTNECSKENLDNPLFEKQKNKNQAQWKSDFNGNIEPYLSFLIKACEWLDTIK